MFRRKGNSAMPSFSPPDKKKSGKKKGKQQHSCRKTQCCLYSVLPAFRPLCQTLSPFILPLLPTGTDMPDFAGNSSIQNFYPHNTFSVRPDKAFQKTRTISADGTPPRYGTANPNTPQRKSGTHRTAVPPAPEKSLP